MKYLIILLFLSVISCKDEWTEKKEESVAIVKKQLFLDNACLVSFDFLGTNDYAYIINIDCSNTINLLTGKTYNMLSDCVDYNPDFNVMKSYMGSVQVEGEEIDCIVDFLTSRSFLLLTNEQTQRIISAYRQGDVWRE